MITTDEALGIILKKAKRLEPVSVPLTESLGKVLAEDIVSGDDIPPFANSAMDGYAVVASDTKDASEDTPVELEVLEDQPAGTVATQAVRKGTAIRIMTGAPLPDGADAVVQVENTISGKDQRVRHGFVKILKPVRATNNVREAGEDVKRGEIVLTAGTLLGPAALGLLASLGHPHVKVFRPARIAIITTGDELLEIDQPLQPGKIRNSNAYSLYAQVEQTGAVPVKAGISVDTKEALARILKTALSDADIIMTTGGVSVGDYDLVKDVLDLLGAKLEFWRVAQKPGKPFGFWTYEGKSIFGLPGNPVATMVCFEEYVRPAARKMMGYDLLFRPEVEATTTNDIKKKPGRIHFIRVIVEKNDNVYTVSSTGPQGSGILKSMVLANGLALIPADIEFVQAGGKVKAHLIDQPEDH